MDFSVKDSQGTNFSFSPKANPSLTRVIHTLTAVLVSGAQGAL